MKHVRWIVLPAVVAFMPISDTRADPGDFQVHPETFDPAATNLVSSQWLKGAGCPSGAAVATYPATKPTGTYTEAACATGDPNDTEVEGLLLLKNGPASNNASAGATITGLPNTLTLTELGYDIPKSLLSGCGGGAPPGSVEVTDSPRLNIITTAGAFFITCASTPTTSLTTGVGWLRLRWGPPLMAYPAGATRPLQSNELTRLTGTVKKIEIVFDEAEDPIGLAAIVLDNIDINGVLVGRGPDSN
jgi:hypothetical protein